MHTRLRQRISCGLVPTSTISSLILLYLYVRSCYLFCIISIYFRGHYGGCARQRAISFWNGLVPLRRIFKRWQEPFCLCPGSVLCLA